MSSNNNTTGGESHKKNIYDTEGGYITKERKRINKKNKTKMLKHGASQLKNLTIGKKKSKLIRKCFQKKWLTIELYISEDIVTVPPISLDDENKNDHTSRISNALINPGNMYVTGTSKLPYFPMENTASLHTSLRTSQWGGLSAGEGMFYPGKILFQYFLIFDQ